MNASRKLVLLFLLLLVGFAPGVRAQTTDLTFFLTFIPNIQFSPLYVAIEKGYFAEAGLNFTLQYGEEPDGVNLIAADQIKFGFISGEQVIQARANERPIVFVYEWFQQFPIGVVVPEDSDIQSVTDLAGRKVGIPGLFGASYSGVVALLQANGMSESDVVLEAIGFNAPEVFCMGAVEAAVVYINNEPLQIQQRAKAGDCGRITGVRVFPVSETVDIVSNGVVTNEATIDSDPQLVQGVVSAFDHALQDVINNPAEAFVLSGAYVEGLLTDDLANALEAEAAVQAEFLTTEPDRAAIAESRAAMRERLGEQFGDDALVQFDVLLNTIELWDADQLGATTPESWEATQNVLVTMGFLPEPTDLTGAFTNDFVDAIGK
jgi:NitT/TauT family transport system substrate-binding protein